VLGTVGVYVALTLSYALVLKHVPWVEMAVVALGFVLRAYVGAAAAGVDASESFLVVVTAAAVHVVASKRTSEVQGAGYDNRPVLRAYTWAQLRFLRLFSAAVLVLSYVGWAVTRPGAVVASLAAVSAVPVVVVLARWIWQTERGGTGAPELVLVGDAVVRAGVATWFLAFSATVFAAVLTV
jgi:decaprenyl-phosphate phosphoribosyltransferase